MEVPILITTAINPPRDMPYLKLFDPTLRKISCKAAIYYWIALGQKKIVIADSTNVNLFNLIEIEEFTSFGVTVEQLKYNQDNTLIISKGKGYGEGLILKYALDNSHILNESTNFYKCTGKIFVRNFKLINNIIISNKINNIFWKYFIDFLDIKPFVDTRFFYCEKSFAKDYLVPAFLESDDNHSACEYQVFKLLKNMRIPENNFIKPKISGVEGGTGELYFDESLGYLDTNFPCWINFKYIQNSSPCIAFE